MMSKISVSILSILFFVVGCVKDQDVWTGGNPSAFDRDSYECERDAAVFLSPLQTPDYNERVRKRLFEKCMKARGWQKDRKN
ncbi:hypothetical protein DSCA_60680 [Desulfosarcina alkanivorans]|uniref:Lipoprotein n=1 Tax=Desulfosarcina alkanivorans TaxID=571177 RepID=A0A5K7YU18_9BACT|nr:hypothetical protein [Desulfosarcina alkanivorans]BBO72138.1 hypothetical protein DSCA_60680 [Desulfosarcina alkanivorans]